MDEPTWLGVVAGHKTVTLGVENFNQTGRIADLYRHFGIDADSIVAAANIAPGRPVARLTNQVQHRYCPELRWANDIHSSILTSG